MPKKVKPVDTEPRELSEPTFEDIMEHANPTPLPKPPRLTRITFREQISWPGSANCSELHADDIAHWRISQGALWLQAHGGEIVICSMAGVEIHALAD